MQILSREGQQSMARESTTTSALETVTMVIITVVKRNLGNGV